MRRSIYCLAVVCLAHSFCLLPAWSDDTVLETLELQLYGHKSVDLPVEKRLVRLENRLGAPKPAKGASEDFRRARLSRVQLAYVTEGSRQKAVKLYNSAVDAASQGQVDKAIGLYQEALSQNPAFLEASNNLATLLGERNRFDEAIQVYQQAQQHFLNNPLLYRNLGVLYERIGKVEQALEQYRQYLALSPNPDPPIRAIVENYRGNRVIRTGDYLSVANTATNGRELTWPEGLLPIPVYIELTSPIHAQFLPEIRSGLRQWETATGQRLRFVEAGKPPQAGIYIGFRSGPLMDSVENVGHASFNVQEVNSERLDQMKIHITLNTGEPGDGLSMENRKEQLERLALHELGHAIGIWGHSPNPSDVMYTRPIVSRLSERDLATIRKLYDLAP